MVPFFIQLLTPFFFCIRCRSFALHGAYKRWGLVGRINSISLNGVGYQISGSRLERIKTTHLQLSDFALLGPSRRLMVECAIYGQNVVDKK